MNLNDVDAVYDLFKREWDESVDTWRCRDCSCVWTIVRKQYRCCPFCGGGEVKLVS